MLFDSPVFFAFLAVVVPLYWALHHRQQNALLLVASYVFYGWWDYRFLGLIAISTVVDFLCARAIDRSDDQRRRRALLAVSLVVNLTFLGFFKYYNFFAESLVPVLGAMGIDVSPRLLSIVLPPGISFYTFQAVAYIVDVYKRQLKPASSLTEYALFISLFPHVIAGPTSPTVALPLGERMADPLSMYLADIYTIGANLAGLPAISVPCGADGSGLPIGLQLIGPAFGEDLLLRVARMHEVG